MISQSKETYLEHWKEKTRQSRLECCLALRGDYEMIFPVRDRKQRQILNTYRLSDYRLTIKKDHKNKTLTKIEYVVTVSTSEVEDRNVLPPTV